MSLVHWDKSVLTLHVREAIEDHHQGDPMGLVGLSAILIGVIVLPQTKKLAKPILKSAIKMGLSLTDSTPTQAPE